MSVKTWINNAPGVEVYAPLDGALPPGGVLIGSPTYETGVDGKCLACGPQQGATIPTTAESARSYPTSVSLWLRYDAGTASSQVLRWGNSPGVGIHLYGAGSQYPQGTVEGWVRMSNGRSALTARSGALAPGVWHLVTIIVTQKTIWGGASAVMLVNGVQVGSGSYSGGLFDIVNFDRPTTLTIGVGEGSVRIDEVLVQEYALSSSQASAFYASADDLTAGDAAGWGVTW